MKRKDFIRSAGMLAASVFLSPVNGMGFQTTNIRVGLIGVNGMGWANLNAILKVPGVQCTALCDVDENVLNNRVAELKKQNITVKAYIDYKELLRASDVDVVIIATPDHWHCLQMVDAVAAGKDVYVEKPIGNSIRECDIMVAAANKYKRVVQVGQWQRSQQHFRDAMAFVHSGKLGKIRLVKAWAYQGWMKSIPVQADASVPAGVHYDKWLGPAPKRAFNPNRFHFNFRWYWDYAGGLMTDWGVHMLDYALIGMKVSDPISVMAAGGKFAYPDDAAETPDSLTTVYEFDGFNVQWEQATGIDLGPYQKTHGVAFIGNNGTLVVNREGWEVIPEKGRMDAVSFQASIDNGLEKHMVNFVEAVRQKSSAGLHAPIEAGAHIAVFSQMGNIAYRSKKKLFWDKTNRRFNDRDADSFLTKAYQNGYRLPTI
ncbi:Gfo/Idh/MocA family oxidoreductase [Sphingobacterium sp. InxBP1]|uniref:Gfo/Idh/MocA family protein n=1 Tax=Sphingobacterium sp. InxBP1 TaxID=2870328 RepID=UPI002243F4A8|nr:Gfo/Idh/MocA family oxidoreductase [Sphingobacterium sp. InxBP1]MCW8314014.1 Gfo/Idh/MocA family oxidoreductase [Sphingobacterium sp. InxBP1]